MPSTLAEKVWERHVVRRAEGEPDLLYIDLHLVHEVTSPQAFEASDWPAVRSAGRISRSARGHQRAHRRADARSTDRICAEQIETLRATPASSGSRCIHGAPGQGIVHVIGPRGLTQPGMTIVCGD